MTKISIIIPIYNSMNYLRDCLESIKVQTYHNIEVIMVNDGSTDESMSIMQEYASDDKRFIILTKQNGGVSDARNFGLALAGGGYVTFADADDWLEPLFCEKMLKVAEENKLDIIECRRYFEKGFKSLSQELSGVEWLKVYSFEEFIPTPKDFPGFCTGFLFKKNIIGSVKFNKNIYWGEDGLFDIEVMSKAKRIGIINESLYHYREQDQSLSHGKLDDKKLTAIQAAELSCAFFHNPLAKKLMLGRVANTCWYMVTIGLNDKDLMKKYYKYIRKVFRQNYKYWSAFLGDVFLKKHLRFSYYISLKGMCILRNFLNDIKITLKL